MCNRAQNRSLITKPRPPGHNTPALESRKGVGDVYDHRWSCSVPSSGNNICRASLLGTNAQCSDRIQRCGHTSREKNWERGERGRLFGSPAACQCCGCRREKERERGVDRRHLDS